MTNLIKTIENEIDNYLTKEVDLSEGVKFSQPQLVKRISLLRAQVFPKGKLDSLGKFKFWFDIISSRINSEVKNIDFDTKDVSIYSEATLTDRLAVLLSNLFFKEWLNKNKKGGEINDAVENFSSLGNVVWKKIKGGYEEVDLKNFYILNQTAKTLEDSDVIERHILTQTDLRAKKGIWENIDEVIKSCGNRYFSATEKSQDIETTSKFYEIYERNGEISEKDYFEAKGESGGDENKYILAKVIIAGLKKGEAGAKHILYIDEIKEKPYKEAHRGRYEGRWFRKGLYEILFDCQTRANEIGNQLARGLEWASRQIFRSSDPLIIQNALTDIKSGNIIKARELSQVEVRMQGFDQLMADWNRNIQLANELANSYEVVTGESLPSGTPFRLGALINQNANKLFNFLREKLSLALEELFNDWIIPVMMKELRAKEVLDLTGSEAYLKEYQEMLVRAWYINNLLAFPPHSTEQGEMLRNLKLEELKKNKKVFIEIEKGFWDNFKPRAKVVISGENVNLAKDLETLATFIRLETNNERRTALIEIAMLKAGVDTTSLPKSIPQQSTGQGGAEAILQGAIPQGAIK